jgi:hypothetical protein
VFVFVFGVVNVDVDVNVVVLVRDSEESFLHCLSEECLPARKSCRRVKWLRKHFLGGEMKRHERER